MCIHACICSHLYPQLTTCTRLHTHYMYSSTHSLHVLVYIHTTCTCLHTTCTCLHTRYMYLSTYTLYMYLSTHSLHVLIYILHVLVYILTTCTCLHTHQPTNQTPSDIQLLAVWKEVPKWELAINLGFPLTDVDSLQQEEI